MYSALSNKFEKECISLAFIIRIYHDARSSECQISKGSHDKLYVINQCYNSGPLGYNTVSLDKWFPTSERTKYLQNVRAIHQMTQYYAPKDVYPHQQCCEIIKCHKSVLVTNVTTVIDQ